MNKFSITMNKMNQQQQLIVKTDNVFLSCVHNKCLIHVVV